jgi:hypothetical protein
MEVGEQPPLRLLYKTFYAVLQPEPLELHRHQLVARHHRLDGRLPVGPDQRTPPRLLRLELGRVLFLFVVAGRDRVVGYVDVDDFALPQLVGRKLVDLCQHTIITTEITEDAAVTGAALGLDGRWRRKYRPPPTLYFRHRKICTILTEKSTLTDTVTKPTKTRILSGDNFKKIQLKN